MVISFDHEQKNAMLSLRQTEILEKLSAIVSEICADCPES
jgi:glutamate--cysteine ligase catalytic subunit